MARLPMSEPPASIPLQAHLLPAVTIVADHLAIIVSDGTRVEVCVDVAAAAVASTLLPAHLDMEGAAVLTVEALVGT